MAARTEVFGLVAALVVATSTPARADDAAIIGSDPGWRVEEVELRTSYVDQRGHGYQSQAGPPSGPGSEAMWLFEPWLRVKLRQSERVVHEITIPVDIVTAASPDAVDAISSASRRNEAVELDVRTTCQVTDRDALMVRLAVHQEEQLRSRTAGAGWRRSFADDNATVAVTGVIGWDGFDNRDPQGMSTGGAARWAFNANVAASQLLSPTTVIDGSYGITQQVGELSNGWSAVPTPTGSVTGERLPNTRLRHAVMTRIAQHLPGTRSTAKLAYRVYADDFGLSAHTIELSAYQYLTPWLYVRAGYRFHDQNGVAFFTKNFLAEPFDNNVPRTADSDLAPLSAHEWSIQLVTLQSPRQAWALSAELLRYTRINDLRISAVSLTVGRRL